MICEIHKVQENIESFFSFGEELVKPFNEHIEDMVEEFERQLIK